VIASQPAVPVPVVTVAGTDALQVNRLVIQKESSRQLVYYWFDQRGRVITNEYRAKWYLFQDSLMRQRSDGALIRLVTPVPEELPIDEADRLLQDFTRNFHPALPNNLPR
jgi:EpsI family protein